MKNNINIPLIIRFCGISKNSMNGLLLMHSIINQIAYLYEFKINYETEKLYNYKLCIKYFYKLLLKYPIILLINNLNKLNNNNNERYELNFLIGIQLHINSVLIISCLNDSINNNYNCETIIKQNNIPIVEVGLLTLKESQIIIEKVLFHMNYNNKQLTEKQMKYILNCIRIESNVLYLYLVIRTVSKWTSYYENNHNNSHNNNHKEESDSDDDDRQLQLKKKRQKHNENLQFTEQTKYKLIPTINDLINQILNEI